MILSCLKYRWLPIALKHNHWVRQRLHNLLPTDVSRLFSQHAPLNNLHSGSKKNYTCDILLRLQTFVCAVPSTKNAFPFYFHLGKCTGLAWLSSKVIYFLGHHKLSWSPLECIPVLEPNVLNDNSMHCNYLSTTRAWTPGGRKCVCFNLMSFVREPYV